MFRFVGNNSSGAKYYRWHYWRLIERRRYSFLIPLPVKLALPMPSEFQPLRLLITTPNHIFLHPEKSCNRCQKPEWIHFIFPIPLIWILYVHPVIIQTLLSLKEIQPIIMVTCLQGTKLTQRGLKCLLSPSLPNYLAPRRWCRLWITWCGTTNLNQVRPWGGGIRTATSIADVGSFLHTQRHGFRKKVEVIYRLLCTHM